MIGLLYEVGRIAYKTLVPFVVLYAVVSSILVYMAGEYVYAWIPKTPPTILAALISGVPNSLRDGLTALVAGVLAVGVVAVASGAFFGIAARNVIMSIEVANFSMIATFLASLAEVLAKLFGGAFSLVSFVFNGLIVAAIMVYLLMYTTGTPPP